jgi:hypothetical protein
MHNPFQKIKRLQARPFTSLPAKFRKKRRTSWSDPNRGGAQVDSFLEGPSFDREGNLWCVDIPFGRIFRIDPKGEWELIVQYDGWPNGLKIHKGGWVFIADYKRGLMLRGLQGPERPALRRQRRSVLHRPGTDRHRRSERARVSPALERRTAAPGGQRALP